MDLRRGQHEDIQVFAHAEAARRDRERRNTRNHRYHHEERHRRNIQVQPARDRQELEDAKHVYQHRESQGTKDESPAAAKFPAGIQALFQQFAFGQFAEPRARLGP